MVFRATTATLFLVALQAVGALAGHADHGPEMTGELRVNGNINRPAIEAECEEGMLTLKMELDTGWRRFPRIQVQLMKEDNLNKAQYGGLGSYDERTFQEGAFYELPSEDRVMCLKPDRCYKFLITAGFLFGPPQTFVPTLIPPTHVDPPPPSREDVERKRDAYRNLQFQPNSVYEGSLFGSVTSNDQSPIIFGESTESDGHFFVCTAGTKKTFADSTSSVGVLCQDKPIKTFRKGKTCERYLRRNTRRKCKKEIDGVKVADSCPFTCGRKEGIGACQFLKKKGGRMNMTRRGRRQMMNTARRRQKVSA